MRRYFLFFILLFLSFESFTQNEAIAIIRKSLSISAQIKNGTYDAHLRIKYLTSDDTIVITGTCRFERYISDTLEGAKIDLLANDVRVLYDGRFKTTIYPNKFASIWPLFCRKMRPRPDHRRQPSRRCINRRFSRPKYCC